MFLLISRERVIRKSLITSCSNDSQVCRPFPNTQGFILSKPLRNRELKRDVLSALHKHRRQMPHFFSPDQNPTSIKHHPPPPTKKNKIKQPTKQNPNPSKQKPNKSTRNFSRAGWSQGEVEGRGRQRECERGGSSSGVSVVAKPK